LGPVTTTFTRTSPGGTGVGVGRGVDVATGSGDAAGSGLAVGRTGVGEFRPYCPAADRGWSVSSATRRRLGLEST
jgi:hypothetical protein